ncbi:MAG TPA: P1 family peptidase [Desulfotignum sp.]|jgi:L-aminopeptidase/D-esterase-like protein|nr:P1 family peptidase [Desulfotignum sp.]
MTIEQAVTDMEIETVRRRFREKLASDALIRYMLDHNPDIGRTTGSVNPLICECNDGYLNDIRGMHVTGCHVHPARPILTDSSI